MAASSAPPPGPTATPVAPTSAGPITTPLSATPTPGGFGEQHCTTPPPGMGPDWCLYVPEVARSAQSGGLAFLVELSGSYGAGPMRGAGLVGALFLDPPRLAVYRVRNEGVEAGLGGSGFAAFGYAYNVSDVTDLVGISNDVAINLSVLNEGVGASYSSSGDPFVDPYTLMVGYAPGAQISVSFSQSTTELVWTP